MKRIVHVTSAHPRTDNRIFNKECRALANAGYEVHALVADGGQSVDGNFRIAGFPGEDARSKRVAMSSLRFLIALRRLEPDLVHAHDPELIPLLLAWKALCRDSYIIYDAHEDLEEQVLHKDYIPRPMRFATRLLARALINSADRFCDGIVAATNPIAGRFSRALVSTVENYPWLSDFDAVATAERGSSSSGNVCLCYVGAPAHARGASVMANLLDDLAGKGIHAKLLIAGPVQDAAGAELVERSDVDYRGVLDASKVSSLLSEADIGLALLSPLPNYKAALPTKVFEYMAAGLPYIASDFEEWQDLFGPYQAGEHVDPEDRLAVVEAVFDILSDPIRARSMGVRGMRAISSDLNFEASSLRLLELVSSVLAGGSKVGKI